MYTVKTLDLCECSDDFLTGNYIRYTAGVAVRIAIVVWLLAMVVLVYAYTGVLTAMLTVPVLDPTVKSLREVATSGRYRLIIEKSLLLANQIWVKHYYIRNLKK